MAAIFIIFVSFVIWYVIEKLRRCHSYWEGLGIQGPKPHPIYGHYEKVLKRQQALFKLVDEMYSQYPNEKVVGMYQGLTPVLILRDPELIKRVLVKDFSSLPDRGVFTGMNDPLTQMLLFQDGPKWRILRHKITPLFAVGNVRQMIPLLDQCVTDYMQHLDNLVGSNAPLEIRSLNVKYTIKVVASIAFGLDINIFTDKECMFYNMAQKVFRPNFKARLAAMLNSIAPEVLKLMGLKLIDPSVSKFFFELVSKIIKERQSVPKTRRDFMDLIIELKEQGEIADTKDDSEFRMEMTEEVMAAQAFMFYSAGFETTSGTMSFLMYELALNPKLQDRCYDEIKQVMEKYECKLTYEAFNEFKYVTMAFEEAMRKHPIVSMLFRRCISKYEFPEINLVIDKGTRIFIPVSSLHMDPKYFPDPEVFDPERFAPENKENIEEFAYLPFGGGRRNCVGGRLGRIQAMMGIVHFLYRFRLEPCDRTVRTIRPVPLLFTRTSLDGLWVNITRR